eukprot:12880931-Prorocentrum_lima.AAC.1
MVAWRVAQRGPRLGALAACNRSTDTHTHTLHHQLSWRTLWVDFFGLRAAAVIALQRALRRWLAERRVIGERPNDVS